MALCNKTVRVEAVSLIMGRIEVAVLLNCLRKFGGHPEDSYREDVDNIIAVVSSAVEQDEEMESLLCEVQEKIEFDSESQYFRFINGKVDL